MRERQSMPGATPSWARSRPLLLLVASTILLITMGVRQSTGLFLLPIIAATGLGVLSVSFAFAVGQLVWGAAQPLLGMLADKIGAFWVIMGGALLIAAGALLTAQVNSELGLVVTLGILAPAGAAAGSFAILIGATTQQLPADKRSFAAGLINAGGSLGQFLFAPLIQWIISRSGWVNGLLALAAAALLTVPLAWVMRAVGNAKREDAPAVRTPATAGHGLRGQLTAALRDRSYLLLNAGFFTCGFHIAFLVTHLPSEVRLCGLPVMVAANSLALIGLFNVGGSLAVGWLGQKYRMKNLLALTYGSRALLIVIYLLMPKTAVNVYLFAAALGFTWLATVPPTAGLVGKLFGTRYLATLFGLTLLSHQIGGFLGAWLGGVVVAQFGSYQWMWLIDIALALTAALISLPIREAKLAPQPVPA
jgi:MFS family permease